MDCSKTEQGMFEVKGVVHGQWEGDISGGGAPCTGTGAAAAPYPTANHWARCGFKNVFHFGSQTCEIDIIS